MSLPATRAIIDAIHSDALAAAPTTPDPTVGFEVVTACLGVPEGVLVPRDAWADGAAYDDDARRLAGLFHNNFTVFASGAIAELRAGGPRD
jgi:phosphoenolpyruvate carboxykinase (ATP)